MNRPVAFPACLAAKGLLFYSGTQFPGIKTALSLLFCEISRIAEGVVVLVPFNTSASEKTENICRKLLSGNDQDKPYGLAQTHDGPLFIPATQKGIIYQIK